MIIHRWFKKFEDGVGDAPENFWQMQIKLEIVHWVVGI